MSEGLNVRRLLVAWLCWFGLSAAPAAHSAESAAAPITVFAAASLSDVVTELGKEFTKDTGVRVVSSFAASSALARQIDAGAPADLFFSADTDWMDYLEAHNEIRKASRHDVVGNRLVLIAPHDSAIKLAVAANFPLAAALGGGRLATGDPDSVPVGRYARAALTALGVWSSVADHLIRADNVRVALAFVARGEAPLGIVYETDARIEPGVRIVAVFPDSTHDPIVYPVALTKTAQPAAERFLDFLRSPRAAAIFARYGFLPLPS
jgi:molybdate transport system substrate-binding protein